MVTFSRRWEIHTKKTREALLSRGWVEWKFKWILDSPLYNNSLPFHFAIQRRVLAKKLDDDDDDGEWGAGRRTSHVVVNKQITGWDEPAAWPPLKLAVSDHFRIIYLVLGFPTRHHHHHHSLVLSIMVRRAVWLGAGGGCAAALRCCTPIYHVLWTY